jgi:hypothetical protein
VAVCDSQWWVRRNVGEFGIELDGKFGGKFGGKFRLKCSGGESSRWGIWNEFGNGVWNGVGNTDRMGMGDGQRECQVAHTDVVEVESDAAGVGSQCVDDFA